MNVNGVKIGHVYDYVGGEHYTPHYIGLVLRAIRKIDTVRFEFVVIRGNNNYDHGGTITAHHNNIEKSKKLNLLNA